MAEIYLKALENTLILEAREFMLRQFNFGTWTEMRMGMFFGGIATTGNNNNVVGETVAISSALDRFAFGIKDSGTTAIPGQTGASFLGLTTTIAQNNVSAIGSYQSNGAWSAAGMTDTTIIGGTAGQTVLQTNFPNDVTVSSGYNAFYAIKFVINNQGLSTQTVDISVAAATTVAGTDYSLSALRTLINSSTYGTARNIAWNTGAAAKTIPNCWFLRLPFVNNRIRMSAIDMIKIS